MEVAGLAVLSYLPFLLSSPGRVSADSKQYLYLDVGTFLGRAPYLWDPHMGAGTVSHQHLGYLFPMGPWFWVMERLGVEVWVAQRLWMGTVTLAAGLGARWLLRHLGLGHVGAVAGALVYMLTPYQLAFTARATVLLLPWAGLPWLIGLVDRAVKRGGWRDPAWFALVVLAIGAVNASSLILVGFGPAAWLLAGAVRGRRAAADAARAVGRIALLSTAVSLWWIAALRIEAAYGLPVLHVTERLATVAATSSPLDVLRGLGNWFFYGRDRLGYSIDQAQHYLSHRPTVVLSFLVPAFGLAAAVALRWAHRARVVLLVLVGAVISVGAWPLSDQSPFASLVGAFTEDTSAGLALRNTARAAPIVVLGLAALIGAAVSAWRARSRQLGSAALVALVAMGAMWPIAATGFLSENTQRVDPIPAHWHEVADALDAAGTQSRVLELPGSPFGGHRWGNTVDPILPGLMERPHISREVLPLGSVGTALLIDALDRRLQEGWLDVDAVAPVARLLGVGTVVLRSDLQYERYLTPQPDLLWELFTGADVPGLGDPAAHGDSVPNVAIPSLPMIDELAVRSGDRETPPPVALFPVDDPGAIVRVAPVAGPVVLAGDADGVVDAAGAGIVDGRSLLLQADALGNEELRAALRAGADLVLTDSNRRRIQTWFYAIRDTRGPTERAGETLHEPTGYDHRLQPFPGIGDDSRTIVEHVGGTVTATSSGGAARPEDRASAALDGDSRTSWRVGGDDPTGTRLVVELDEPVRTDRVVLLQPQDGPRDRVINRVRLRLDGAAPIDVEVGPASIDGGGQAVGFDAREVRRVEIEITGVTSPPFDPGLANAVGFAEVRVGDATVSEVVRPPVDLLRRADGGLGHRLDVVLTRLRYEPGQRGRLDQERRLERRVEMPRSRSFAMTGTARVNPNAPDQVLDEVLGTDLGRASAGSSGHLEGDLGSRASRALDGDASTAWRSPFGPSEGRHLQVDLPERRPVGPVTVAVVADGEHSIPTRLRLETDAGPPTVVDVPDAGGRGAPSVTFDAPAGPVSRLRIVVEAVSGRTAVPGDPNTAEQLPIAIADISASGLPQAVDPVEVPAVCRPLVAVDGQQLMVRVIGPATDARRGLSLELCGATPALSFDEGANELRSAAGLETGIDVDQLVLSSAADGSAGSAGARGARRSTAAASISEVDDGPDSTSVTVHSDGEPFWLTFGQSLNDGWDIDVDGGMAGPRRLVDGYANGWLVEPDAAGTMRIQLTWTPQRLVWLALAASAIAALACVAIVARPDRGRLPVGDEVAPPTFALAMPGWRVATLGGAGRAGRGWFALAIVIAGGAGLLVATPLAAAVAVAVVAASLLLPGIRLMLLVAAPGVLLMARAVDRPALAWLSLAALGGDQLARWVRDRARHGDDQPDGGPLDATST